MIRVGKIGTGNNGYKYPKTKLPDILLHIRDYFDAKR